MKNISKEDYVLWNYKTKELVEDADTVYHYTSIIELLNDGMVLELAKEEFICVTELPLELQRKISEAIEKTK